MVETPRYFQKEEDVMKEKKEKKKENEEENYSGVPGISSEEESKILF